MTILGLDIGTTTISAVVLKDSKMIASHTEANDSFIASSRPWEKIQDPARILSSALGIVEKLTEKYPDIQRIGITGQQHGILYLDGRGKSVSPLYTWQDERGDLPFDRTCSYASRLSERTGKHLATGYGIVTHFYNLNSGLVPDTAVTFCTVADYVAMTLAENTAPALHPSNAASFGLFDLQSGRFCEELLEENGIPTQILPHIAGSPCIGMYKGRIPVFTAIGDNQASFLGATKGDRHSVLVNVGTGSQISICTRGSAEYASLETRPYLNGDCLLVGSSLCGGRAYALLESFFRAAAEMVTGNQVADCYDSMNRLLDAYPKPDHLPLVSPLFQGTRQDPRARAVISGLDTENFRPLHLIYGMMYGMADELYSFYEVYKKAHPASPAALYGSGNGLRKNPHLCRIVEERFQLPLRLTDNEEEAACGAALFAKISEL